MRGAGVSVFGMPGNWAGHERDPNLPDAIAAC